MLKITEIAFGLEESWRHRHRDAVCVPHHVSLVALMFGILAGDAIGAFAHVVLVGALIVLLGVLCWMRRRKCATFRMAAVAGWLGVWCALWFVTGVYHGMPREPVLMPAGAQCEVAAEIEEIVPGAEAAVIEVRQFVCDGGAAQKTRFKAKMRLNAAEIAVDRTPVLARGTRFGAVGTFEPFEAPDVPGMYDSRGLVRSRGIWGTFRRVRSAGEAEMRLADAEESLRRKLEIGRRMAYEKLSMASSEGILPALVLGAPRGIEQSVRDRFGRLGIAHVLAVSGLHFGMIAILFNFIFIKIFERCPRIMRRWGKSRAAMMCALPALAIYLFFVGAPISAQRALLMTVLCFMARAFKRSPERSRALCAAGMIILCISPGALFEIGFQLSFSAVLGIVWALDIEARCIEPRLLEWDRPERFKKIVRYLASSLLVTVSTALTTAPFVIYHFGRLPLLGILTNLIVIPYVSLILMPIAMITAMFAVFGLPFADRVAQIGSGAERLLAWFADISVKYIPLDSICVKSDLYIAIIFGGLAVALLWRVRMTKWRSICAAVVIALAMVCVSIDLPRAIGEDGTLRISFIAMGQADSTLIEFADGTTMLIDAGSEVGREENAAERRLLPYLQARGVRAVDILVLTHGDYDHVAGVIPLLENMDVGEIWFNGAPPAQNEPPWREVAAARDIDVKSVLTLARSREIGKTSVDILWPIAEDYENINESSVVLRLIDGEFSAIFMGDAGIDTEMELLMANDIQQTTLLKAGHHGSKSATSDEFVEALQPRFAVFSVGRYNRYHFPHPSVVRRLEAHAHTFRTDRSGTVLFRTDGNLVRVQTMR
ncbi:MAG: DNA internalization-related competence protein ComEC/Rec2 [Proteobacteria bacterium]|nr:DNA internalization-related competence protein ComEC/Rec2 [Pseudomonadota bacterium]